jgi:hypothetical protein
MIRPGAGVHRSQASPLLCGWGLPRRGLFSGLEDVVSESLKEQQSEETQSLMPDQQLPIPIPCHCLRCGRGAVCFIIGANGLCILGRHRGRFIGDCAASGAFSFLTTPTEEAKHRAIPADTAWSVIMGYVGSLATNETAPKAPPEVAAAEPKP